MTPERKDEIKRDAQSGGGYEDAFILNQEVLELLAALEAAEKLNKWYEVAFSGRSEALEKAQENAKRQLAEAQQTIARQREALQQAEENFRWIDFNTRGGIQAKAHYSRIEITKLLEGEQP